MNQPAFILEFSPNEVPAITAARALADDLAANVPSTRKRLSETFTRLTGATDADNRWSLSDTHAAVELAQLLYLQAASAVTPGSNMAEAFDCFDRIESLTPIQYNRSEEQLRFQQFSTPLRLAWIAARAAALSSRPANWPRRLWPGSTAVTGRPAAAIRMSSAAPAIRPP